MKNQDIEQGRKLLAECQIFVNSIDSKIHGSSKLNRRAEIRELNSQMESISSILDSLKTRQKFNPIKRELRKANKTLSSLIDGLEDNALSAGEYRSLLDESLYETLSKVNTSTNDLLEKLDKNNEELPEPVKLTASSKDGSMSNKEVLSKLKEAMQEAYGSDDYESSESIDSRLPQKQREELDDAQAKKVLSKYSKFRSKVPRKVEYFTVSELPVVPIFKDFNLMSDRVLTTANVRHTRIGQHLTVFDKSIILAFNRRAVNKALTPKSRNAQNKMQSEYDSFVYDLVDTINSKSAVKYSVVSRKYNVSPFDKNIMYVWLMPAGQLARLRQSANDAKGIELISWGFPWGL